MCAFPYFYLFNFRGVGRRERIFNDHQNAMENYPHRKVWGTDRKEEGRMMTASEIYTAYWAGELKHGDGKFSWEHPDLFEFFKSQGVKLSEVRAAKGRVGFDAPCVKCGTARTYTLFTRTEADELA